METPFESKQDKFYILKPFRVPKYRIEFHGAKQLSDVPGYVWYTPAALYLWGRFTDVNLSDIVQNTDINIYWYKFEKPIFTRFTAMGDSSWNHLLWAAREDQWDKLWNAILEVVQFDLEKKILYQFAMQHLNIYDPLHYDKERILKPDSPVIKINTFNVLSNLFQVAFDVRDPTAKPTPGMKQYPPDKLHVDAARYLFAKEKLNQDGAFERYRDFMIRSQDAEHQRKADEAKRTKPWLR